MMPETLLFFKKIAILDTPLLASYHTIIAEQVYVSSQS